MGVKNTHKYATVRFLSTYEEENSGHSNYTYLNSANAQKYDVVLVETRYGVSLAVVKHVSDVLPDNMLYRNAYSSRELAPLKEIVEVIKSKFVGKMVQAEKKKELEKTLDKKIKELDKTKRFELYASDDPEFAELLKQYKAIK